MVPEAEFHAQAVDDAGRNTGGARCQREATGKENASEFHGRIAQILLPTHTALKKITHRVGLCQTF